jgi:hypothetical protein
VFANAEHVRLRDERWTTMIAWVDEHGTPDQKSRLNARLLPPSAIKEAMAEPPLAVASAALHPRRAQNLNRPGGSAIDGRSAAMSCGW